MDAYRYTLLTVIVIGHAKSKIEQWNRYAYFIIVSVMC